MNAGDGPPESERNPEDYVGLVPKIPVLEMSPALTMDMSSTTEDIVTMGKEDHGGRA